MVEITSEDNLLSVELVNAPLIDVLRRIEQEFGYKAHYHGELDDLISLTFNDLPLEKGLRRLTANHSLSVASRPALESLPQDAPKHISEVWVLSKSSSSKSSQVARSIVARPPPIQPDNIEESDENVLEQIDSEDQEDILLDQVLDDPDTNRSSQQKAIANLVKIGGPASVMAMAAYLGNEDKELRQLLVDGIGSIQNEQSTEILGQVLQSESDPEIRKTAVRALGKRRNDDAAQAFLEEARNDADEEIKALADQLTTN